MVNYPVLPVLASISIPATAFPSPGHVPEITYRLFAQLPRLAARSTSFSLPLRPPLFVSPSPFFLSFLSFFFFFVFSFRFSSFVGPFTGEKSALPPPTCPFVQLPKTVYDLEDYVRDLEFPRATSPFFSLQPLLLFSLSLRSTLWIKTPRLLTFSPPSGDHRRTRVELEKYVSLRSFR